MCHLSSQYDIITLPPIWSIVMSMSVFLPVRLSVSMCVPVYDHIFGTTRCYYTPVIGSIIWPIDLCHLQ